MAIPGPSQLKDNFATELGRRLQGKVDASHFYGAA